MSKLNNHKTHAERGCPLSALLDGVLSVCAAMALVLDMNLLSGNNYHNWAVSFPVSPVVTVLFLAVFYVRRRAAKSLPDLGAGSWGLALFLGAWWVMAKSANVTHELNQPFLTNGQMLKSLVTMAGMACLYDLLIRLLYALLAGRIVWEAKQLCASRAADLYRRHTMLFCTGIVLLMWLPHMLITYPCTMNADTATQVEQALGLAPRVANHPPFGTMLLEVFIRIGYVLGSGANGLYLYTLVQCIFAACVIGYSHMIMRKLHAPVWLRALSLLVCCVMPVYCDSVTVLIKDIPYVYAAVLLICEMIRAEFLQEEGYALGAGYLLRVTFGVVILLNIRNNGLGIVVPVMMVMLLRVIRRKNVKLLGRAVLVVVIPFVLTMGIEHALNDANDIQPRSPREGLSLPFQQTARFVRDHGDEIPPEEREAINAVLLYDRIGDFYNPMLSDPVKATYKEDASLQDLMNYFRVWGGQFWRDPACYVKATLIQNALLFDPHTNNVTIFSNTGLYGEAAELLDVSRPGPLRRLEEMEMNLHHMLFTLPLVPQLNSMGFYCILLLMTALIVRRMRVKNMTLLLLPMYVTLAMLVLGPCIEYQDRYGFPIIYCMPLILACLSHELKKTSKNEVNV